MERQWCKCEMMEQRWREAVAKAMMFGVGAQLPCQRDPRNACEERWDARDKEDADRWLSL